MHSPKEPTFLTSSLPLAAYLVASESLEFRGIELTNPKSAELVFDDPQGRGREIERQFMTGGVVPAFLYLRRFRELRRAIDGKTFAAHSGDLNSDVRNYNVRKQFAR